MKASATGQPSEVIVEAVITKADGTVIDLGEISYYHRSPWKRLTHKFKRMKGR